MMLNRWTFRLWLTLARPVLSGTCPGRPRFDESYVAGISHENLRQESKKAQMHVLTRKMCDSNVLADVFHRQCWGGAERKCSGRLCATLWVPAISAPVTSNFCNSSRVCFTWLLLFLWLCSMFDIQCESASRSQALSQRHLQDVSTYRLGLLKLNDSGSPKRTSVLPWSGGGEQKAVGDRVIGLKLCGVNRADGVRKNAAKWDNFTVVGM